MNRFKLNNHLIEVEFLMKGYNNTLVYFADGVEMSVTGEFYIDKHGFLHHSHIFEDGTEIEFAIEYK